MKSAEEIRNGLARILEGLQRLDERLATLEEIDRNIRRRLARVVPEELRNREDDRRNFQTEWPN